MKKYCLMLMISILAILGFSGCNSEQNSDSIKGGGSNFNVMVDETGALLERLQEIDPDVEKIVFYGSGQFDVPGDEVAGVALYLEPLPVKQVSEDDQAILEILGSYIDDLNFFLTSLKYDNTTHDWLNHTDVKLDEINRESILQLFDSLEIEGQRELCYSWLSTSDVELSIQVVGYEETYKRYSKTFSSGVEEENTEWVRLSGDEIE